MEKHQRDNNKRYKGTRIIENGRINKDHKPRTWKIFAKLFRLYKMRKTARKLILEIYEGARLQETKNTQCPFYVRGHFWFDKIWVKVSLCINFFYFLVQFKSEERSLNDSRERSLEQDTRQELTQKVLLSFARQIAVGMVTKFYHLIDKFQSVDKRT